MHSTSHLMPDLMPMILAYKY